MPLEAVFPFPKKSSIPDPLPTANFEEHANSQAERVFIYVTCADDAHSGTKSDIGIQIFGQFRTTGVVRLNGNSFEPGKTSGFIYNVTTPDNDISADSPEMTQDPGPPLVISLTNMGDDAIKVDDVHICFKFKDHDPNDIWYRFKCNNAVLGKKGDFGLTHDTPSLVSFLGTADGKAPPSGSAEARTITYDTIGHYWANDGEAMTQTFEVSEQITAAQFDSAVTSSSTSTTIMLSASAEGSFAGFGASASASKTDTDTTEETRETGSSVEESLAKRTEMTLEIPANTHVFVVSELKMTILALPYTLANGQSIEFCSYQSGSFTATVNEESIYKGSDAAALAQSITDPKHRALFEAITS